MTIAEVARYIDSVNRVDKIKARERASYDYIQAALIVRGVSICLGAKDNFPPLQEAYSGLFAEDAAQQQETAQNNKMLLSALRFKQFAHSYNNKFNNKVVAKEECKKN